MADSPETVETRLRRIKAWIAAVDEAQYPLTQRVQLLEDWKQTLTDPPLMGDPQR